MDSRLYDPFDPEVLADPHPWYRALRDEAPLHHVARRDYWVLTRYDDVHAALRDHATYSSARGNSPEPGFALGVIGTDPPKHTRLRRIVQGVFTPKVIERNWGDRVRQICEELVERQLGAGPIDAFRELTLPLPITVIAELLGVPDGDFAQFKAWSDDMVAGVSLHLDPEVKARTERAFGELWQYFTSKVAERRARPGKDLLTMLCEAGYDDRLTDKETVQYCILLLIAGNETTTNLTGNGIMALAGHPEEQQKLRADAGLLNNAIEEMLRFCPPTQAVFRQTTREVELLGKTIPADRRVMLSLASANRDSRKFEDGMEFRVDRANADEHLAFGSGVHFCVGSALARLESRTLFATILKKTRDLRPAGEPKLISTPVIRGPIELPIELVAR